MGVIYNIIYNTLYTIRARPEAEPEMLYIISYMNIVILRWLPVIEKCKVRFTLDIYLCLSLETVTESACIRLL